jgi:hypothetical protein
MDKIPVIELAHLSETQKKALIIADNKLVLNADWDNELLGLELKELDANDFNLDLIGFDVDELRIVMGYGADFDVGTEDEQGTLDKIDPITCPSCGHEFHK